MPYEDEEKKNRYQKQWRKNNPDYIKEYSKQYRENNREMLSKKQEERCKKNPGYFKEYYKNNLEKWKIYNYNGKDRQEYQKKWFKNNPEKVKIYNKSRTEKRSFDLKSNLNNSVSTMMWRSLKGNKNGRHWEGLVDYTLDNLIKRLKLTMPDNYTWDDYLQGKLHIDHIIPISAFNFTKSEHTDFKRCWALSNLRLLPAKENLRKRNKLDKPFQPALLLESFQRG